MRNMFGNLLTKRYPAVNDAITLNQLLEWEMWPGFIKIYGM